MENNQSPGEEVSILSLLQKIKDGTKNPRDLEKGDRQRCVEVLFLEGYSEVQIAQVLDRSEKTIRRDFLDIRKRNALTPNINHAKEFVGEMNQQVRAQISRLTRIAVSRDSKPEDRINAEALIWKIHREYTEVMQTLGYLPLKPTELVLTQHDQETSLADSEQALSDILRVSQENGTLTPELEAKIKHLQTKLEKRKLDDEVARFLSQQNQSLNSEDSKHEQQ